VTKSRPSKSILPSADSPIDVSISSGVETVPLVEMGMLRLLISQRNSYIPQRVTGGKDGKGMAFSTFLTNWQETIRWLMKRPTRMKIAKSISEDLGGTAVSHHAVTLTGV
jgi:hypothetical protein